MNPRLLGGEMLLWSDLDGGHGPGPVRGAALAALLPAGAGLLPADAGLPPAGAGLLPAGAGLLPAGAGLLPAGAGRTLVAGPHDPALLPDGATVLIRGLPDATVLARTHPVLCGSPAKLAGEPPWDTIVALDGLDRLGPAEEPPLTWGDALENLLAVLRPGGTLLLGLENLLGLHRLVALPAAPSDSDWTPAAAYDGTRPAGLAAALARLGAAGLTVTRTYAAFPSPVEPAALIPDNLLADPDRRGWVEATLSAACAPLDDVLIDPGRLAVDAARHGLAAGLAPGWVFVARRGTHAVPAPPQPSVATGPTLEFLLLKAAAERDLPGLRTLLRQWQAGPAAAVAPGRIVAGAGPVPGAPSTTPARAVYALAVALLSGGFPHPWPAPAGPGDLTLTLAAMAGVEIDPADLPATAPRPSVRDLLIDRDRLIRQLTHAWSRHEFLERTIADRDRALTRSRQLIALLSTTRPARTLLAAARWTARRVRP